MIKWIADTNGVFSHWQRHCGRALETVAHFYWWQPANLWPGTPGKLLLKPAGSLVPRPARAAPPAPSKLYSALRQLSKDFEAARTLQLSVHDCALLPTDCALMHHLGEAGVCHQWPTTVQAYVTVPTVLSSLFSKCKPPWSHAPSWCSKCMPPCSHAPSLCSRCMPPPPTSPHCFPASGTTRNRLTRSIMRWATHFVDQMMNQPVNKLTAL